MITIKGKEIRPETVSMWFNIIGFIASIIFYLSVEHNFNPPTISPHNPIQDSLMAINTKLRTELENLQAVEKGLLSDLQTHKEQLVQQQKQVNKVQVKMTLTIKSDWDSLSKSQQDSYTDQLIKKLKKPKL